MIISPLKLVISALAAITAAIVGSFFGDQGTLIGVATGSVVSGAAAGVYEHVASKTKGVIKFAPQYRKLPLAERQKLLKRIAIASGASVLAIGTVSAAVVVIPELASGRTLHSLTTGKVDYGSSFGSSSTVSPAPVPTIRYTPSATPSVTGGTQSAVPTSPVTPSPSFSATSPSSVSPTSAPPIIPSSLSSPQATPLEGTPTP